MNAPLRRTIGLVQATAMVGGIIVAELASAYPLTGGVYVYLTRAFRRGVGFLCVRHGLRAPGSARHSPLRVLANGD